MAGTPDFAKVNESIQKKSKDKKEYLFLSSIFEIDFIDIDLLKMCFERKKHMKTLIQRVKFRHFKWRKISQTYALFSHRVDFAGNFDMSQKRVFCGAWYFIPDLIKNKLQHNWFSVNVQKFFRPVVLLDTTLNGCFCKVWFPNCCLARNSPFYKDLPWTRKQSWFH